MQTNRDHIKIHRLSLRTISDAKDIVQLFRENKIDKYVYEVRHLGYILKYGLSNGGKTPGERVYRQIANIPQGWNSTPRSNSGKDFAMVCTDFSNKYGIPVNKNNIEIVVHDMTNYLFEVSQDPAKEVKRFEAELIDSFTKLHGERPIGNLRSEKAALVTTTTPDKIISSLFHA